MTSDPTAMCPTQAAPENCAPAPDTPASSSVPSSNPDFSSPADIDLTPVAGAESVLIALDFDGVLAPLQDNPDTSQILPETARAIAALNTLPRTQLALVSGRDIATLRRLAKPPENVWLVGSHGAEVDLGSGTDSPSPTPSSEPPSPSSRPEVSDEEQGMLAAIDAHIDSFEHTLPTASATEFRVENKPYSRTVHTRGLDPELASALHAHVIAVQTEHRGIRVIEGHDITELAVKTATKGDGLRSLVAAGSPSAVLYLGDDVTDEDAFAELEELSSSPQSEEGEGSNDEVITSLGIKVGPAPTRAKWRITDPAAVAVLLELLADERRSRLARS